MQSIAGLGLRRRPSLALSVPGAARDGNQRFDRLTAGSRRRSRELLVTGREPLRVQTSRHMAEPFRLQHDRLRRMVRVGAGAERRESRHWGAPPVAGCAARHDVPPLASVEVAADGGSPATSSTQNFPNRAKINDNRAAVGRLERGARRLVGPGRSRKNLVAREVPTPRASSA